MSKKKFSVLVPIEILKVGEPTINGRVYPEAAIQKLVESGSKRAKEGRLLVEDRRDTDRNDELMDIRKVVGVAKDVRLDEDEMAVMGTIDVLAERPDCVGEVVRALAESGQGRFFPIGKGTVREVDGVQTVQADYEMTGIGFEFNLDRQGEIAHPPEVELDLEGKKSIERAARLAEGMAEIDGERDAAALSEPDSEDK